MALFSRRAPPAPAPARLVPPPPPADRPVTPLPGRAVNPLSRAVHPREQYPRHFDFLMRDLFQRGEQPEQWQVISADESRLDEDGMDIDFTLLRTGTDEVHRRRVVVRQAKLVAITDC
ncbi:MAG: hypothetical protein H0X38_01970 [Planctomycetes bacterium]|nr:hypothetical protein [Planctomycetota bacterium]